MGLEQDSESTCVELSSLQFPSGLDAHTHLHTRTHMHAHTLCFLPLLKEFQLPQLPSWEDSSFPFFRFIFLPCILFFSVSSPLLSFLHFCLCRGYSRSGPCVPLVVWWSLSSLSSKQILSISPSVFLFTVVRVGRAHFLSLMDHFIRKKMKQCYAFLSKAKRTSHSQSGLIQADRTTKTFNPLIISKGWKCLFGAKSQ